MYRLCIIASRLGEIQTKVRPGQFMLQVKVRLRSSLWCSKGLFHNDNKETSGHVLLTCTWDQTYLASYVLWCFMISWLFSNIEVKVLANFLTHLLVIILKYLKWDTGKLLIKRTCSMQVLFVTKGTIFLCY